MTKLKTKQPTQARGRERRQLLIQSAKDLLDESLMTEVSLADVARHAGIPTGSAYHFFPNVQAVYQALSERFSEELDDTLRAPYVVAEEDDWLVILDEAIDRAIAKYESSAAYRQLIIGGRAPAEIKLSDRQNDEVIGKILIDAISKDFVLPEIPRAAEIFFYTVEIIDLFFTLSVQKNEKITAAMRAEARRASHAYLLSYFPSQLPRR